MSKVFLSSFATPEYQPYLKDLVASARKFGIDKCICYNLKDLLKTSFYRKHKDTFGYKTGFGFWLWKPFFVNQALTKLKQGDILMYVDAATLMVMDPTELINIARSNQSGIVSFDAWPLENGQWTKRDAFVNTNCDSIEFWSAKKVIATVIIFRKTEFTENFCHEWLKECENIESLSDLPNVNGKENCPNFIAHRMDQSILAILIKKYNIETYRNPSKWGNFLKMEQFRVMGEHISSPYLIPPEIETYFERPYTNSPYGTIFEFNQSTINPKPKKVPLKVKVVNKVKRLLRPSNS